jgi:hypothetical protein
MGNNRAKGYEALRFVLQYSSMRFDSERVAAKDDDAQPQTERTRP